MGAKMTTFLMTFYLFSRNFMKISVFSHFDKVGDYQWAKQQASRRFLTVKMGKIMKSNDLKMCR